jgi:hypothetical protein
LDALKGRLDGRECDAPTLADVHVWLLLFTDDLVLTSESEVGLQQQLDTLQQLCIERGLIVNVEKTKAMVFNCVDSCQEFVFKGDAIERVQTFKYLGILLETTSNLDNAVEHVGDAIRCSLFALNRRCAELRIMDVKLRCNLFNTLVRSTTSYVCEVWVDSKKIKAIEVVYRGFLKFLLGVRKTISTSIVLTEFGKFPFEHFAWGQALLYYNHVSMTTKDCILGKAWEAQLIMLVAGKKCWVGSVKKWVLNNQPKEVTGFLLPIQSSLEMAPPGFPHTMLNVKRVKHNMQLAFIEELFTNREIGTGVQTRYLRFKGMSYESEGYLCDISCVQLWKALSQFRCGNSQLEVVLGAWKGVLYTERLCQGCDLGKVEDEKHLLLVCPSTQKVKEHFCSTLSFIHINTFAELMQTTNTIALAKFMTCCLYQRIICPP